MQTQKMVASVLAAVGNEFLDVGRSRVLIGDMNQPPSAKGVCVLTAVRSGFSGTAAALGIGSSKRHSHSEAEQESRQC